MPMLQGRQVGHNEAANEEQKEMPSSHKERPKWHSGIKNTNATVATKVKHLVTQIRASRKQLRQWEDLDGAVTYRNEMDVKEKKNNVAMKGQKSIARDKTQLPVSKQKVRPPKLPALPRGHIRIQDWMGLAAGKKGEQPGKDPTGEELASPRGETPGAPIDNSSPKTSMARDTTRERATSNMEQTHQKIGKGVQEGTTGPTTAEGLMGPLLPLSEVKRRRQPGPVPNPEPPLEITMKARRNDLSQSEKAYINTLKEGDRSGSQKYDFVPPSAAFIYRCTIPGCVSPHSPTRRGLPINANGIKNHMKCHITRDHSGLQREVHIRVETRHGRIQHHTIPRIVAKKIRKRYGVTYSDGVSARDGSQVLDNTQTMSGDEGGEQDLTQVNTDATPIAEQDDTTTRDEVMASKSPASEKRQDTQETEEEEKPGEQTQRHSPELNRPIEPHTTIPAHTAHITGNSHPHEETETLQHTEPSRTQVMAETGTDSESELKSNGERGRRRNKPLLSRQTGRAACYGETVSLSEMTNSVTTDEPPQGVTDAEELSAGANSQLENAATGNILRAQHENLTDTTLGTQHTMQIGITQSEQQCVVDQTLQALLGMYASQPNEATREETHILQIARDQLNQRAPSNPWEGAQRPSNHPMSSQYTIHPTTLEILQPLGSTEESPTSVADGDQLTTDVGHETSIPVDTMIEPGHADYLMAGSDDELVHPEQEPPTAGAEPPMLHHAAGDDDEEPEPETSDEECTTSPLPLDTHDGGVNGDLPGIETPSFWQSGRHGFIPVNKPGECMMSPQR